MPVKKGRRSIHCNSVGTLLSVGATERPTLKFAPVDQRQVLLSRCVVWFFLSNPLHFKGIQRMETWVTVLVLHAHNIDIYMVITQ